MLGMKLPWWAVPVLFIGLLWRTPQFWIALAVVVMVAILGFQVVHAITQHITWVK